MSAPEDLRQRIEADIRDDGRAASIRSIFAQRVEAKKSIPVPFDPNRLQSPVSIAPGAPDSHGEGSDGFDYYHAAQADYQAVCANLTGSIIPDSAFDKLRLRRVQQKPKSIKLAEALESTGRFADKRFFYGPNHPDSVSVIDLMSGAVIPIPALRRVNFFPAIAAANRSKMLKGVEHFINCRPLTSRMYTITNGPRVAIHRVELREDIQAFHRRLSKLAAKMKKRWGIVMQWRATEFGEPKWDPETGQMTLHLHAHILVTEPERTTDKRRAKVRRGLWKLFGVHWDDAGRVENAREFVKYPVKDADLDTILDEGGPGMLADFYEATRGLHIVQPMGEFKSIRSIRRKQARRITAFNRRDGRQLEETGDWNAMKRPLTGPNKNRAAYLALAETLTVPQSPILAECLTAEKRAANQEETERLAEEADSDRPRRGDSDRKSPRIANRVIALLAPAPYGGPICAPGVVAWGFDGNLAAVLNQPRVAAIIAGHRDAYDAAVSARALIRACADAQARAPRAASEGSQRSNNCPGGLAELALADASGGPPGYETEGFGARN